MIAQTTKDLLKSGNKRKQTKAFIAIRTKATEHAIAKQTSPPNRKQMPNQTHQMSQNISTQNQYLQSIPNTHSKVTLVSNAP